MQYLTFSFEAMLAAGLAGVTGFCNSIGTKRGHSSRLAKQNPNMTTFR